MSENKSLTPPDGSDDKVDRSSAKSDPERSHTWLQGVLDAAVDGIIVADATGKIVRFNAAAEGIFGYRESEVIGANLTLLMPDGHVTGHEQAMASFKGEGRSKIVGRGRRISGRRRDGTCFPMYLSVGVTRAEGERFFTGIVRDIGEQVQAERKLELSEHRLSRSQSIANIGTWDWDIVTDKLYWSELIGPLFGYENVPETTYENFLAAVHPDDRPLVIEAVNNCVVLGDDYDIEHRVVWPDGSVRWMHERGDVLRDESGNPTRMLGVVEDITPHKHSALALSRSREILSRVSQLQNSYIDERGIRDFYDSALKDILSLTDSEYGFIGEVLYEEASPYLLTRALTDISWDETTRKLHARSHPRGLELRNLASLFGVTLRTGKLVISNDPAHDPRRGGLPFGHAPLNAFMGMPLRRGRALVGMVGVANRSGGYDAELAAELSPLLGTCASVIAAQRAEAARARAEAESRAAREQAERASRAKSEFLSNTSHELRTPLYSIVGLTDLLRQDPSTSPKQLSVIKEMQRASDHLLALLDDLLDLSKIESGHLEVQPAPVPAALFGEECMALVLPLAAAREIRMSSEVDASTPIVVWADASRLRQVLLNLLSNAIKYNHVGGKVELRWKVRGEHALVEVLDDGPGLSVDDQSRVFLPFSRAKAQAKSVGGTGIGLSLSRRLVELMGGQIGVESELGRGSTFWVELPLANADMHPDGCLADDAAPNATAAPSGAGRRLLVVEDNIVNQEVIAAQLRFLGYSPTLAANGQEALELWREEPFEGILTDLRMDVMDGFEFVKLVREGEQRRGTRVPIIGFSASIMPEDRRLAELCGFDDYLLKPTRQSILGQRLERLFRRGKEEKVFTAVQEPARSFDPTKLARFIGDDLVLQRASLDRLLSSLRRSSSELELALANHDRKRLAELGRELKASSRAVGANDLADRMYELELAARDIAAAELNELIDESRRLIHGTCEEILAHGASRQTGRRSRR